METKKLTASQIKALAALKALEPFTPMTKIYVAGPTPQGFRTTEAIHRFIATGQNTKTLRSLREKGLITYSSLWLSGACSPDLAITDAGRKA